MGPPEAAPLGTPEGAPLGAPLGMPEGCWQDFRPEVPLFEDDESPEPQAARARGESASSATAGTRRFGIGTRFMRDSSKQDEGVLRREL